MASPILFSAIPLFISLLCVSPCMSSTNGTGFSLRLMHRDSPLSPLYNPNATTNDLARAAYRRTKSRIHYLSSPRSRVSPTSPSESVFSDTAEYIMGYEIGTPPVIVFGVLDTASELIWLQCSPCVKCYDQRYPPFEPLESRTYKVMECNDTRCFNLITAQCSSADNDGNCYYSEVYGDTTHSKGDVAIETMTFDDNTTFDGKIQIPGMVFGCGHDNAGSLVHLQMGIIGFSREPLSLISQLKVTKFSHCFVPRGSNQSYSNMNLGDLAKLTGVQTPIGQVKGRESNYYLTLDGISVGDERLVISSDTFKVDAYGNGGFIIDTGLSFTVLKTEAHEALITAVVNKAQLGRSRDLSGQFELCFEVKFSDLEIAPDITFHFAGGLDMVWSKLGSYVQTHGGLWCLAVVSTEGKSILGNFQMQNFNIGYDIGANLLSIDPIQDCDGV